MKKQRHTSGINATSIYRFRSTCDAGRPGCICGIDAAPHHQPVPPVAKYASLNDGYDVNERD